MIKGLIGHHRLDRLEATCLRHLQSLVNAPAVAAGATSLALAPGFMHRSTILPAASLTGSLARVDLYRNTINIARILRLAATEGPLAFPE